MTFFTRRENVFWCLGFLAFAWTHLIWITWSPGFHYDEGWAAHFAQRIAFEPGFWPLSAQSPYTSPWSHYWTALFFRTFGVNVAVFRAAGVSLVGIGLILMSQALRIAGHRTAASLLPWVLATSLPLLVNHRFSFEITTFHVFCFGLVLVGAAYFEKGMPNRGGPWVAVGVLLGVTSHLLFLAVGAALLAVSIVRQPRMTEGARKWALWTALLLTPFLVQVFRGVPERDKSGALLACNLILILWLWQGRGRNPLLEKSRRIMEGLLFFGAAPFLLLLSFFAEGHWGVLQSVGSLAYPPLFGLSLFIGVFTVVIARKELQSQLTRDRLGLFAFATLAVGCLMLSPSPRYFEIPLLLLMVLLSLALEALPPGRRRALLALLVFSGLLQFISNELWPSKQFLQRDSSTRFLFLKDQSRDFLPKQQLAARLGEMGCRFSRVQTEDSRIGEPLRFLSEGDWPLADEKLCGADEVWVSRRIEPPQLRGLRKVEDLGEFSIFRRKP